jgi:tetratricopeptide (TPR) repeat protein
MASTTRIDELKKKFDENPRRYFAPLANEFRKAGDIEQAIMICEEFLPQQPGHMSGHIVYGQALYEAGRLPESRTVFETALGLDPENLIALRHLGDIAQGQGDVTAARGWYMRVLDADPRNDEIQGLLAALPAGEGVPIEEVGIIPDDEFDLGAALATPTAAMDAVGPAMDIEKEVPSLEPPEPALEDTSPFGVPLVAVAHTPPPLPITEPIDVFRMPGLQSTSEKEPAEAEAAPAPGFESTSFAPPSEEIPVIAGLDDSLDSGVPSFEAPTQVIAAVDGLQVSAVSTSSEENVVTDEYPLSEALDVDDGKVLPPQGDPIAASAGLSEEVEPARAADTEETAATEDLGMELPPSVIAAEAELIAEGESPAPTAATDVESWDFDVTDAQETAPAANAPFVTETMAELYAAQGFREQALAVYVQLLAARPDDVRLQGLVASLAPGKPVRPSSGPTVREFFARMANRRPGMRHASSAPPSDDDFAHEPTISEPEAAAPAEPTGEASASEPSAELAEKAAPAPVSSSSDVAPAIERAAAMRTPTGSIDALFGNRSPGTSEDSAASALAQAFGATAEAEPLIVGRPSRAASAELSLDSVFRDGPPRPPRTSQSFSFDQFFTGAASTGTAERSPSTPTPRSSNDVSASGEPPAERSAEDIQQFNSWLQGLKPR